MLDKYFEQMRCISHWDAIHKFRLDKESEGTSKSEDNSYSFCSSFWQITPWMFGAEKVSEPTQGSGR
jgi:hypothetical protein